MRIDVKKFLFWGVDSQRSSFFQHAQEYGCVQFIGPVGPSPALMAAAVQPITAALKVLRALPAAKQKKNLSPLIPADAIAERILSLHASIEKLLDDQRLLNMEIVRLAPLGEFDPQELAWIEETAKRKVQFFCGAEGVADAGVVPEEWTYIATEHGFDYFMAVSATPYHSEKFIELKATASLATLKLRHEALSVEIHRQEKALQSYEHYREFLSTALNDVLNDCHLQTAEESAEKAIDAQLFIAMGWVPSDKVHLLEKLAADLDVHSEEIAIEESDAVPTCLANQGFRRIGEDLVQIYDTPSANDKDPSLWVLAFFALFFAMIIGDAGYGLVLLITGMVMAYRQRSQSMQGRRMIKLGVLLATMTILWGALTTSFFGISFAPDSPMRKVSLISWLAEKKALYHAQQGDAIHQEWLSTYPELHGLDNAQEILMHAVTHDAYDNITYPMLEQYGNSIMLEMALFVGCVHIIFSFARYLDRNIGGLGWISFIIGAYLYLPFYLGEVSSVHFLFNMAPKVAAEIGKWLMAIGFAFVMGISIAKHRLFGLLEAMNVIQIFGDVMSYLRIYALGLAGALVTATLADLASGVNIVFAVIILAFGHLVNIILSVMGGVIHGLRLNFLEWYHYSFEGGGRAFMPLRKINKVE
jgi:V/A-type H+-transporting ATPase subunit I